MLAQSLNTVSIEPDVSPSQKDHEDALYLLHRSDQDEIDRLYYQHDGMKILCGGIFKAPVQEQLEKGIRVLDCGCGPGSWSVDMAKQYPKSTFQGFDLFDTFPVNNKPENCSYMVHDITKPLPYPDNHFDFVYQRLMIAGIRETEWPMVIENVMRVVKPGGYIELMETMIPDIFNCGPKYSVLREAAKYGALEKGIRLTQSREIELYMLQAGATNVVVEPLMFPLGKHGGLGGEAWGKSILSLYRYQLKDMVSKRKPELEDPEKYEQFLQEVAEECIEYKSSMLLFNMYAQKPHN